MKSIPSGKNRTKVFEVLRISVLSGQLIGSIVARIDQIGLATR